ncbi:MAG: DUF3099 domain-containing protein [Micrococcaceae bacterium]|nr:DUF3099 domain-containing protein [Micrococcaceae bacterium]
MSEPHSNNHHRDPGPQVHRITEAQESHSVEQHSRVLKYTISMSVRLACFIAAFFVHGWLQWVFLSGAIVLPYIAVVIANGGADLSKRQPPAEFYEAGDPHRLTSGFTAPAAGTEPGASESQAGDPPIVHEEGESMFERDTAGGPATEAGPHASAPWPGTPESNGKDAGGFPAEAPTTIEGSFVEDPKQAARTDGHGDDQR